MLYHISPGYEAHYKYSMHHVYEYRSILSNLQQLYQILSTSSKSGSLLIAQHSLGQRFHLARQIATAVFCCHSIGWVHKFIDFDNIIILIEYESSCLLLLSIATAFLAEFEYSRRDVDRTTGPVVIDSSDYWRIQLYQHSKRQVCQSDVVPKSRNKYKHDFYSLGVVLLELAR